MKEYIVYLHDGTSEVVNAERKEETLYVYNFYVGEVVVRTYPVYMVERIVEVKE